MFSSVCSVCLTVMLSPHFTIEDSLGCSGMIDCEVGPWLIFGQLCTGSLGLVSSLVAYTFFSAKVYINCFYWFTCLSISEIV